MIILSNTTDKIQVLLSGSSTSPLPCYASFRDTQSGSTLVPGRGLVVTNGTTPVDLVASPGSSTQRGIDNISVTNIDSAPATVTVRFNADSVTYILTTARIDPGERLEYTSAGGWRVLSNSGGVKQSVNQGSAPISTGWTMVVLATDVANDNAVANTIADVTGLSFAVTAGNKYAFRAFIEYTAAATATGSRWSLNGPSGLITYSSRYTLATNSQTLNSVLNSFDLPAASNASSQGGTSGNISYIEGYITPGENGTIIVRFASEVANSAITAKAGSFIEYIQVL